MSQPTIEQLAYAFELQSRLGMTVENRSFHVCTQIGFPHEGYARHKDYANHMCAQYAAVVQCANSYFDLNPDEKPADYDQMVKLFDMQDKHDDAGFLIRPEVKIEQ